MFWIPFNKEDARRISGNEKIYPCYYPTNRRIDAPAITVKVFIQLQIDLLWSEKR